MKKLKEILGVLALSCLCFSINAQNPEWIIYKNDTLAASWIEEGMEKGEVWLKSSSVFSTKTGEDWKKIKANQHMPNSKLLQDKAGNYWISIGAYGARGLYKYENENWVNADIENSQISGGGAIDIDSKDNIWYVSDSLYMFDHISWKTYFYPSSMEMTGTPYNNSEVILIDKYDNLWVGTIGGSKQSGLYKFNGTTWTNYNTSNSGLSDNWVTTIKEDKNGVLWIGTGHGFNSFDGTNWQTFTVANSGCVGDFITSMFIDDSNKVYIGTVSGISIYDGTNWANLTMSNSALPNNKISALYVDDNQNLWISMSGWNGTENWDGLAIYNNNGVVFDTTTSVTAPFINNKEEIKIYPNPAKNTLTVIPNLPVRQTGVSEESIFTLYNLLGQKVKEQQLKSKETTIDISGLPQGMYLYDIHGQKGKIMIINP